AALELMLLQSRLPHVARPRALWATHAELALVPAEERKQPTLQIGSNLGCASAQLGEMTRLTWLQEVDIHLKIAPEKPFEDAPYLRRGDVHAIERREVHGAQEIGDLLPLRPVHRAICRPGGTVDEEGRVGEVCGDSLGQSDAQPLDLAWVQIPDTDCHRV